MPDAGRGTILWGSGKPGSAGEGYYRRRVVLPALALTGRGWDCRLGWDWTPSAACVILDGLQPGDDDRAWQSAKSAVPIVFDAAAALAVGDTLSSSAAARCARVAGLAAAIVVERQHQVLPEWLSGRDIVVIPDPVETAELAQQAARNLSTLPMQRTVGGLTDLLWYAEPGDDGIEAQLAALSELAPLLRRIRRRCTALVPGAVPDELHRAADCVQIEEWSLVRQFDRLHGAAAVILPGAPGSGGCTQARRARQALFAGIPVVAASGAATDELAPPLVLDDWERGLRQSPAALLDGIRDLQARGEFPDLAAVGRAWDRLAASVRPQPAPRPRRPYHLMVFADLIGDTDLCIPLIAAAREHPDFRLTVAVTSWLLNESPRIGHQLAALGVTPVVVDRREVLADRQPALASVDGLFSPAPSSHNAHKRAQQLVERARRQSIPTFCMQHGVENPGLTYFDAAAPPVRITTDYMFVWFPAGSTPASVPEALRPRLVHVGCNKPVPVVGATLPDNNGRPQIGIFENLHWERYSQAFKAAFEEALRSCAMLCPDVTFLLKPHHGGRWSVKAKLGDLPKNVLVIDSKDPVWERHTAPTIIAGVDAVITTPSTVAFDAVRAGKPTAVVGGDLSLPMFEPLPLLRRRLDWVEFVEETLAGDNTTSLGETFLRRSLVPGVANQRMLAFMLDARPRSDIVTGGNV